MALNLIKTGDSLSHDAINDSTRRSMTDTEKCRELRSSSFIERTGVSEVRKLERQESIETFELPKSLITQRQWPNKIFHHIRWVVMFLASSGLALMYLLRLSITVAIVKMVNHTAINNGEYPFGDTEDPNLKSELIPLVDGEFVWSNLIQSLVINVYFIGYALPQIYLSYWAGKNGVNKPVIISQIVTLIAMALMPSAVYLGWQWAATLRFIMGLGTAVFFPIFFGMIDKWFPSYESTRAISMLQFFVIAGTTTTPLITSYLCSYHWSWAFYGFCFIGAVWLLLWLIVVSNTPEECWLISQQELKMILSERAFKPSNDGGSSVPTVPWKKLFASRNFYIMVATFVFYDGTQMSFGNLLPTYMRVIMGMNMTNIGLTCTLIQSAALLEILWGSELLRFLIFKLNWSGHKARTLVYCIASTGALITWILPTFINRGENIVFAINKCLHQAVELVMMGTIIDDWSQAGLSGIIFSVYNTIGCALVPAFCCCIGATFDAIGDTQAAWNWLFSCFGFINFFGFILFLALRQTPPNIPANQNSKEAPLP